MPYGYGASQDYYDQALKEYEGPSDSDQSQASLDEQLNQIVGKKDKGLSTTGVDPDTVWGKNTGLFKSARENLLAGKKLSEAEKAIAQQYIGSVPTPYSGAMDRFMKTSPAHAKAYTDKFGGMGKLNLFMTTAPEKIISSTLPGKILSAALRTGKNIGTEGLDWLINEKNKEKHGLVGTSLSKAEEILTGKKTDDGLYTSEADALAAYNAANPDFAPLTTGEGYYAADRGTTHHTKFPSLTTGEAASVLEPSAAAIDFNINAPIYKEIFERMTNEGMNEDQAYERIREIAGSGSSFPFIIDHTTAAGLDLSGGEKILPAGGNIFTPELSNATGVFNNPNALSSFNPGIQDEGIWQEYIKKLSDNKGVDFNISEQELEYNKPAWGGNLKFSVNPEQTGVFFNKSFGA